MRCVWIAIIGIAIMIVRNRDRALDWAGRVWKVSEGEAQALC